jgi:hypothetical protein
MEKEQSSIKINTQTSLAYNVGSISSQGINTTGPIKTKLKHKTSSLT